MSFLTALQFLTTIPIPWQREARQEDLARSIVYFPVVGLIIGLILAGLSWLLAIILPSVVANVLLIVSMVILTGAIHLDGFVDTCDGIAGHKSVEERWKVMHDSRAGAFGIIGLALLLLVKYVSLNSIPWPLMIATLLFMPVVSRWAMVYAIFAYPYARPTGLGKAFNQGARWPRFTVATLTTVVIAVVLTPLIHLTGLVLMFAIWVITVVLATYLKSKFSGLTGDTYGAINEVAEGSVLILINILVRLGLA